jgi:H+/Cl- antiporter ClcA
MGAVMGRTISRLVGLGHSERETFVAAAGGAGVATMFNSPLGCAAYTVEAVLKRVDFQIAAITLGMGGIAVAVTRLLIGREFNFVVNALTPVGIPHLPLFFLLTT